jgi:hypothetical protein
MSQSRSAEEVVQIITRPRPVGPICAGVLAFLGNPHTFWGVLSPAEDEAAASAMTHVRDCTSCTYRLAGLQQRN